MKKFKTTSVLDVPMFTERDYANAADMVRDRVKLGLQSPEEAGLDVAAFCRMFLQYDPTFNVDLFIAACTNLDD
jgi:hypothetical protein